MNISHINHSSLRIETETTLIWTDPWVISPAFRAWTQDPYPYFSDIEDIGVAQATNKYILVSHGHDDHLDDFVLASHPFRDLAVIIPKLKSPGLRNRILATNPCRDIIEIDSDKHCIGDLFVSNYINPGFTGDDTIFVIQDLNSVFIHANDNWHEYSDQFSARIRSSYSARQEVFYAVQLGIADPFPAAYNFTSDEKERIIKERYAKYLKAIKSNSKQLNACHVFSYANQSRIPAFESDTFYSAFKQQFFDQHATVVKQLQPGVQFDTSSVELSPTIFNICKRSYIHALAKCLHIYECKAKEFIKERLSTPLAYDFCFRVNYNCEKLENVAEDGKVYIEAAPQVWADILIGNSNVEAITVGGSGSFRIPKNLNISQLHHLLCKWTYKQQSEIKSKGLLFYLEYSEL